MNYGALGRHCSAAGMVGRSTEPDLIGMLAVGLTRITLKKPKLNAPAPRLVSRNNTMPILLIIMFTTGLSASCHAAAPSEGILIDQVWSGHPVGFALLTERGHQFIAYYDAQRRLTITGRKLGDEKWVRIQPPGVLVTNRGRLSNVTGWDSHNRLQLALDRDGCLHLSGNMHVDPLVYYRTRKPFDLATLERIDRMTGERELRATYPNFFKDAKGDLIFRYRDGSSGNGSDLYNIYDPATHVWRRLFETPLLEGEGERNAYSSGPVLGTDGRFHLAWVWRDTPDAASNHTLSYARSRDLVHWETSTGKPISLPITLATGEVIDDAKPGEGLVNMTYTLGFDSRHRPLVAYHRYDEQGLSQIYAARPNASGKWDVRQISEWTFRWEFSGGGSLPAEVRLGRPEAGKDGSVLLDFWTKAAGAGRWRLDGDTLAPLAQLPALPLPLPANLRDPQAKHPGLEVQSVTSRAAGLCWILRWETLGPNRDHPRETAPPPTELRLYEFQSSPEE